MFLFFNRKFVFIIFCENYEKMVPEQNCENIVAPSFQYIEYRNVFFWSKESSILSEKKCAKIDAFKAAVN